ncbi:MULTISPECIES: phosphatidate cytidylyltransferase [unclassified Prochlorococcus]|uniref:phosphatidate cytidylyltransferase n=1 Tax=unclassified Prochlorococcus TaxID=2627481 RepID=UPI000533BDAA|nr:MULTISPECIES: phosphatidate cytidylyltransferase [unclassified Prochlorococcus]KGG15436.1 Phosphatidate cytidylyltransferase [Prochlorococcus sp. MIT 0602]KGG17715.1 Phosphatidate cytidylyltransferase [Prochlorococcus sp. MIT 0603]
MASLLYSKRIVSGLCAGLFGLLVVGIGGVFFTFALCSIVHLALIEYFRMAEFAGIKPATKTTLFACQILLITTYCDSQGFFGGDFASAVLALSGALICLWLLLQPVTGSISDIAASIFGLFYLGYLPSYWIRLRNLIDIDSLPLNELINNNSELFTPGLIITLVSCLMIVASDIGSYYFGRIFGKIPLTPISPSKTIEGAVLGIFCSIFIGILTSYILNLDFFGFLLSSLLGALVGLLAIVGDLIESMLKRDAGIKDSGNVLPGHGGIFDRIDSYIFTPSIVYYLIKIIIPIVN